MSIDESCILSAEDAALFETAINRRRKRLDRDSICFLALLIFISMLAGFCGGLPFALASHPGVAVETCVDKMQAGSPDAEQAVRTSYAYDKAKRVN